MYTEIPFADVAAASQRLYRDGRLVSGTMQRWRPYICPFERLLRWVRPESNVLDVGCGSGLFLGLCAELIDGVRGIGFDASEPTIRSARQMQSCLRQRVRDRLEFRRLDARDPWPEGHFDVVALIDVMHHVPRDDQPALVANAADKLAPGGMLIYKDISPRPLWRALANRLHDFIVAREAIHLRPMATVAAWLTDVGLKQVHCERANRLWYAHDIGLFARSPVTTIQSLHFDAPRVKGRNR